MSEIALRARVPGAVRAAVRPLDGRDVVWVEVAPDDRRGALSSASSSVIEAAARSALDERLPLVCVIRSSGADIVEGIAALHGWGRAARALTDCSGIVPTIFVVDGPAVSGPALLLGIADHVVMTEAAYAFVSGPTMVAEFTGVEVGSDELGGASTHARYSGAATLVAADIDQAIDQVSHLLAYFPSSTDEEPPRWATTDPEARSTPEAGAAIPPSSTGSYDVRTVISALVDDGELLELRPRWAGNVVTALATMGGMPIGIVANQPLALAGTLDIPASQIGGVVDEQAWIEVTD